MQQRSMRRWAQTRNNKALCMLATVFICSLAPIQSMSQDSYVYEQYAPYNDTYTVSGQTFYPMRHAANYSEQGMASWYGSESGDQTAMGTYFDPYALTAAHKTLPLPTKVRVTNLSNGLWVDVIVNDRGPFVDDRIIDLSEGAASVIGLHEQGVAEVRVEALGGLVYYTY